MKLQGNRCQLKVKGLVLFQPEEHLDNGASSSEAGKLSVGNIQILDLLYSTELRVVLRSLKAHSRSMILPFTYFSLLKYCARSWLALHF